MGMIMSNRIMKTLLATALAMVVTSVNAEKLPDPLVIATEGAYPPFNYVDSDGNVKGFEIDLANAMCDELNANCEFVTQDWDGIIPGLLARKYDAVIGSLYITEDRKKKITFSDKYYQTPARFVVPSDSDIEITDEGLSSLTVGTQRGTSFERMMRDQHPDVDLRVYGSFDEVYQDLVTGRVDVVIDDVVSAKDNLLSRERGEAYELRGPEFTNPEWFGHGAGVAVRHEDAHIAEAFSEAIAAIREDGTYQEIADEWFGFDVYGE
ncbi:MAG: transporter substrate-binding domain-containing protein [Halofilum sp. (in: g-proteobacteria)]|nr:transporter substrate-binding domain-containing protein [Halofilum sp. (in: g-proteobacteria)]